MSERPAPADPQRPAAGDDFEERLWVPWWWWPIGLGVGVLLAAEVHLGHPGLRAWLPYLLTVPAAVGVLVWLGRHRVRVAGEELIVGPARLPLQHIGTVELVEPIGKRRAMGPELDPAAFVVHRPWVGPLLRVELTDPADPTPYWLFSARRADELATVLRGQVTGTGGHPPRGE